MANSPDTLGVQFDFQIEDENKSQLLQDEVPFSDNPSVERQRTGSVTKAVADTAKVFTDLKKKLYDDKQHRYKLEPLNEELVDKMK